MDSFGEFVDRTFTDCKKWRNLNFHDLDNLVVDSQDVFERLYLSRHPWDLGGQYYDFYTTTREFFGELLSSGVKLIMVLRGPQPHKKEKLDFVRKCKTDANDRLWKIQTQNWKRWQSVGTHSKGPVPHLAWSVFVHVVSKLGLTYYVTKEAGIEGKREISALANHHQCPVLAASADYFMFELNHGYVPFDTLSTIIASGLLYHTDEFQAHFSLKSSDLRFLVPAIYGNDVLASATSVKQDFITFLKSISEFDKCEAYLTSEAKENLHQKIAENFETAKKLYSDLNYHSYLDSPLLNPELPRSVALKANEGFLHIELINVLKCNTCVLSNVVEHITKESAWLASRPIRQYSYGLLLSGQEGQVKEVIRAKGIPEVTEVMVPLLLFDPARNIRDLDDIKDVKMLRKLVLSVSGIPEIMPSDFHKGFDSLDGILKLPVCATYFWYHTCDSVPRNLVKSLILSFLTCGGMVGFDNQRSILEPPSAEAKQDHFSSLHAFAQWQCTYHDLMGLNYLLKEPFISTNPALLFSGRVVMFYASFVRKSRSPDEVINKSSEAWSVYNNCLYLITGSDAEGKRGAHAKMKINPKTPVKQQPQDPKLSLSNRFDALLLMDD